MKHSLFRELFRFALSKKNFSQKLVYLFKAIIFAPLLYKGTKRMSQGEKAEAMSSQVGDDIYPLF